MPVGYRVEKWREFHRPNPAMLRHILVTEGYEVFQWSDLPGVFYGSHMHGDEQSHWVVSGTLELSFDTDGPYILEPGDRDFMPARTYHSARVVGEEVCIYIVGSKQPEKRRKRPASRKPGPAQILREMKRIGTV